LCAIGRSINFLNNPYKNSLNYINSGCTPDDRQVGQGNAVSLPQNNRSTRRGLPAIAQLIVGTRHCRVLIVGTRHCRVLIVGAQQRLVLTVGAQQRLVLTVGTRHCRILMVRIRTPYLLPRLKISTPPRRDRVRLKSSKTLRSLKQPRIRSNAAPQAPVVLEQLEVVRGNIESSLQLSHSQHSAT
jgi:hypothetical protein